MHTLAVVFFVSGVFQGEVVGKASLEEVYQLVTSVQQEILGLKEENARLSHLEEEVAGLRAENVHLQEEVVGLKVELANGHSKYRKEMVGYSFTVGASSGETFYSQGQRYLYSHVISNVGDAYSVEAREFRCPVDGIYLFSGSTMTGPSGGALDAVMKRNGAPIAIYYAINTRYAHGSGTVVVECKQDDRVWVECGATAGCLLYGHSPYITFSGVLLQA